MEALPLRRIIAMIRRPNNRELRLTWLVQVHRFLLQNVMLGNCNFVATQICQLSSRRENHESAWPQRSLYWLIQTNS